jgi:hypothetical protein
LFFCFYGCRHGFSRYFFIEGFTLSETLNLSIWVKNPFLRFPLKLQTSRGEGFALMAAAMGFPGIYAHHHSTSVDACCIWDCGRLLHLGISILLKNNADSMLCTLPECSFIKGFYFK